MRLSIRYLLPAVAFATLCSAVAPPGVRADETPSSINVSQNSSAFGEKFNEWSAEWWQYVLSLPGSVNPILDTTGENCAIGQRGPVWFLLGALSSDPVTRACSVPEGKALFFPVINQVDINTPTLSGRNQTAADLRAEIAPCLDAVTSLSVTVDGKPVTKVSRQRIRSAVFDVTLPPDSLFSGVLPPGTYSPAVDDGYYVMLKPLPVGTHTIHISAARGACPLDDPHHPGFSQDVTYDLTVVPVSLQ